MPNSNNQQSFQKMFEDFGLGTTADRQQFMNIGKEFSFDTSPAPKGVLIRLGNSSTDKCFTEGGCGAKLESDS